jgi:ATP-dependent helicase/DNAse subunit B
VPLTLITGPANSGKAALVFAAVRREARHGAEPWLVVPTASDARHYQRELASGGNGLGVRVARFRELADELARRAQLHATRIDEFARERILSALVSEAGVTAAPRTYVRELGELVAELESLHVSPQRLRAALRRWARSDRAVSAQTTSLGLIFERYQKILAETGALDPELRTARALSLLRESPRLWWDRRGVAHAAAERPACARTAVLFYGFDDLTALQLEAIGTLARAVSAHVTVALAYECGRAAFAGRVGAVEALSPWASEHIELPAASRHYAPRTRAALSRVERRLFEPNDGGGGDVRVPAGEAIKLIEGAGERTELELVAAEIRALLDRGLRPREIALVHRAPAAIAAGVAEALGALDIPFALDRRPPFAQTALGRGLLALLRCALLDGCARDLLAWLRAPGVVKRAELVDRLELQIERGGLRSASAARALWEAEQRPLSALDRVRAGAERGPLSSIDCVEEELWRLFSAPRSGAAWRLAEEELDDADALRVASAALAQLRELVRLAPAPTSVTSPAELVSMFEALTLSSRPAQLEAVPVVRPIELRARRVRALFLCGLQAGLFPRAGNASALLGEEERRFLAERAGLALERRPDSLAQERYLLYACVSRPEELLVLSWHKTDDEGREATRSLFVDDICELFDESLFHSRRRATLVTNAQREHGGRSGIAAGAASANGHAATNGTAAAGAPDAPAAAPRIPATRATPVRPLQDERLLGELRARRLWSASSLEAFACCPVRWFVEHLLRPKRLEPPAEAIASGRIIHEVLKDVLEGLRQETGSCALTPPRLGQARALMRGALARRSAELPLSALPERAAPARRRLEADLERYLEHTANQPGDLEPAYLELPFGFQDEPGDGALGALDLGNEVRVRGRIDRIDVGPAGEAVVYDYKRSGRGGAPGEKWLSGCSLQVALYMRACRELLGLEAVGGFYQPVSGEDLRARGALAAGASAPCIRNDRYERPALDALVERTIALAREAAAQASAGELEPRPHTCSLAGKGCMYPTICRCQT